jgi:hypothetical protein
LSRVYLFKKYVMPEDLSGKNIKRKQVCLCHGEQRRRNLLFKNAT